MATANAESVQVELTVDQRFVIRAAIVLVTLIVIGAGALYFILVLEGREVPAAVGILLGAAMGNIANIILGKQSFVSANQVTEVTQGADKRSRENQAQINELMQRIEESDHMKLPKQRKEGKSG
jgi:hypothetical protein